MAEGFTSMRYCVAGLAFLVFPTVAWADHFEEIVGLQCDTADGQLTVVHQGATTMLASRSPPTRAMINGMFEPFLALRALRGLLAEAARFVA